MYSRDLSRKVRSAMKTHAKNGEYMPAFPKYGYIKDPEDKHHLVIDPEAAETVKLIFTMAADGKTKGQMVKVQRLFAKTNLKIPIYQAL